MGSSAGGATGSAYDGTCAMCGWVGTFGRGDEDKPAGSDYPCGGCGAPLRYRDEAAVLVDEFGRGVVDALGDLCVMPAFSDLGVYYVGVSGPVRAALAALPGYVESTIEAPVTGGSSPVRRSYQDLRDLGYADGSFDLMFSSHIMEHVPEPGRALDEAHRVLRPGGRYLFSLPLRPEEPSRVRVAVRGGELHHLEEPHYHRSPHGRSLVVTDFGGDVVDLAADHGFVASVRRPTRGRPGYLNAVVVAIRADGATS